MFYPSPLRTSGDADGSVKGVLIPSFPGSDPTGKWAPCVSGCPSPSKASCSALLCVRETVTIHWKSTPFLAVEGSPGSGSSPSARDTFMYLASVGIQVFQCLKEAECTALVNWSYISVHEMSSFGSWRGSHTSEQQCCCLHTIGKQGFPLRIARPDVVTGELPSWIFISVNAISLRIDYLILFDIFSRICAQSGVCEYISSAIY